MRTRPPSSPRRSGTSKASPMVVAVLALGLVLTACAPATVASVDDDPTVAADGADSEGGDAERLAAEAAASEAAASEAAAAEAAASEAAASEAARIAAEEEAARIAAEEAAAKAAEEEAARIAAEEEAARIAAEEEAARKAAEEEARRLAEEEDRKNRATQTALQELGYYDGVVDGDAGPVTIAAVKDFQSVNGLKVDGVVGPQTETALASDNAKPKPPPPPKPKPAPDGGSTTELPPDGVLSVTDAKRVLTDLEYYGGEINGDASASFRTALTAFQKVEGLAADGVLGPNTSARLRSPSTPSLRGGESNRIEIDLDKQVIHVVKGGVRIRTMPTSSGNGETYKQKDGGTATALTPVGTFRIERRITGIREADLGILYDPLYFHKGYAIHGSNSVPSYPASHGCTRVSLSDIKWLANQMPNGTQVMLYGGTHVYTP